MTEKQVKDYDKFNLRFPDGMRDAIAERAKRNGRSMNSEIIQILEDALCGVRVNSVRVGVGKDEYLEINPNNPKSVIEGLMKLMNSIPDPSTQTDDKKPT
ncbi:Arc family DNA-binding protein [Salmonella enterica subsp. enterica]